MSPTPIERLALYFGAPHTRQALLARRALGVAGPADAGRTEELAQELGSELRPDGSIRGAAVPTIWRAHELMDLGCSPREAPLAPTLRWLLDRQGAPGAYGEGCDRTRHAQRICRHYLGGFFSAAPASERLTPITLPNGKVYRAEPAARFAISCLALRAALRAGLQDRAAVIRHLESLALLSEGWAEWAGSFTPDAIVAGLHALALGGPAYLPVVERLVDDVLTQQRVDGQWVNADFFQVLETLTATGLPAARTAVRRALPVLEERQRADGSFGPTAQQERALIGLRAFLWAAAD